MIPAANLAGIDVADLVSAVLLIEEACEATANTTSDAMFAIHQKIVDARNLLYASGHVMGQQKGD